jgi:hypothetical protein
MPDYWISKRVLHYSQSCLIDKKLLNPDPKELASECKIKLSIGLGLIFLITVIFQKTKTLHRWGPLQLPHCFLDDTVRSNYFPPVSNCPELVPTMGMTGTFRKPSHFTKLIREIHRLQPTTSRTSPCKIVTP